MVVDESYWHDANGHPVCKPGSFVPCGCPAQLDGRGHFVYYCRVDGCTADPVRPPRCDRPTKRHNGTGMPGQPGFPGKGPLQPWYTYRQT